MAKLDVPFNIDLLIPTAKQLQPVGQIKVLDIFAGSSSRDFHPMGLFSVEYFGRVGEERRNRTFGYIDLKIPIFHPIVFKAIKALKGLYYEILAGESYAIFDTRVNDFVRSNDDAAETGFHFFVKHFDKLTFPENKSSRRDFNIKMVNKYRNNCMLDKHLVLPAGLRDLEFDDADRPREDEINTLYRGLLMLTNLIQPGTYQHHPESLDDTRFRLQLKANEIYEYLKKLIDGKKKFILGKWADRKTFNSTFNVITALQTSTERLHAPNTVNHNQTQVGLYQYMKATLPLTIYQLRSGFLSNVFGGPNDPARLVNPKTLKMELVTIDPKYYDLWMTDEGLNTTMTKYGEQTLRHEPITIGEYYLGLIYKGPDQTYMLLQDIDELPEGLDKKYVEPVSYVELFYLAVYQKASTYPSLTSRYPISGYGSIYPAYMYLKTTVKGDKRERLDEMGKRTGEIAYEFPIKGQDFINSLSPNSAHLSRLGADGSLAAKLDNCPLHE